MGNDFVPRREAQLLAWGNNYQELVSETPTEFGLDAGQGTAVAMAYAAFANAYAVCENGATRSPANVATKRQAKADFVSLVRQTTRVIQAWPDMTDAKREQLQITVRDTEPTPSLPIVEAPVLQLFPANGYQIPARLRAQDAARRGKPEGVDTGDVFISTSAEAPLTSTGWTLVGSYTRTSVTLEIPSSVLPGQKIWVTAYWRNVRGSGPYCAPQQTMVTIGGLAKAA